MVYALRSQGAAPSPEMTAKIEEARIAYGADRVTISQSETGQGIRIRFNDEDFQLIGQRAEDSAGPGSTDDDMDDVDAYAATEVEYAATEFNDDVDMEQPPVAGPSRVGGHATNGASIASRAEMGEGGSAAAQAPLDKDQDWAALRERMVRALVEQATAAAARGDQTGAPLPQNPTHQATVMQELINDYLPAIEEDFWQRLQAARTYNPSGRGKAKAIDPKRVEEIRAMAGTPYFETTTVVHKTRVKNKFARTGTLIMDQKTGQPEEEVVGLCTVRRTKKVRVHVSAPYEQSYLRGTDRKDAHGAVILERLKRIDQTTTMEEVIEEVEIDTA